MMGWLLAFLVHSSLWLSLAWLCARLRPNMHARIREAVWCTAIAASLIAPTVQTFASQSTTAFWRLPFPASWSSTPEGEHQGPVSTGEHAAQLGDHGAAANVALHPSAELGEVWPVLVFWLWVSIACALLLRYLVGLAMIRRQLAPHDVAESSPERKALSQLSRRAGLHQPPRLTESENVGSPSALGVGPRAEICVPTRALHELDDDQFRAMLAHEVAHHMRRDPLRFAALNLLRTVFFFQPLYHVAARELHLTAEEQCDAWAANHLEDRLAMARCLTEVATWVLPRDRRLPIAGMARRRSHLGVRVRRLIDEKRGFEAPGKLLRVVGSTALLALAPWLAPSVAPGSDFRGEELHGVESERADDATGEHGDEHREEHEVGQLRPEEVFELFRQTLEETGALRRACARPGTFDGLETKILVRPIETLFVTETVTKSVRLALPVESRPFSDTWALPR